jgi:hypothetical protein
MKPHKSAANMPHIQCERSTSCRPSTVLEWSTHFCHFKKSHNAMFTPSIHIAYTLDWGLSAVTLAYVFVKHWVTTPRMSPPKIVYLLKPPCLLFSCGRNINLLARSVFMPTSVSVEIYCRPGTATVLLSPNYSQHPRNATPQNATLVNPSLITTKFLNQNADLHIKSTLKLQLLVNCNRPTKFVCRPIGCI